MHNEVLLINNCTQRQVHEQIDKFLINSGVVFLLTYIGNTLTLSFKVIEGGHGSALMISAKEMDVIGIIDLQTED